MLISLSFDSNPKISSKIWEHSTHVDLKQDFVSSVPMCIYIYVNTVLIRRKSDKLHTLPVAISSGLDFTYILN